MQVQYSPFPLVRVGGRQPSLVAIYSCRKIIILPIFKSSSEPEIVREHL